MKKFLKIISIFTAAAVLLGLMCLSIALFYPGATQNILMFSANKILQGMTVRDLVIKKQVYRLPRQFTFKDVSWTLTQGRETYVMSFGAVQVSQIMDIISSGKGGVLQLKDGMVKVSAFRLEGVDVRLVSKSMPEWAGRVSVKEAESNGFKVRDIDAQAVMTSQEAVLSGINGDSYRGKVMGSAHIYFVPEPK